MKKLEVVTEFAEQATVQQDAVEALLRKVDVETPPAEPGLARAKHLFDKGEYVSGVIVEGTEDSLPALLYGLQPERARWVTEDLGDGRVVCGVCDCGSANGCAVARFEIRKTVRP